MLNFFFYLGQSHREARNEMALDDISKHVNDMKVSMPTSSRVNDIQNHQVQSFAGDSQNESFSEERNFEQELKDEVNICFYFIFRI